MKGLYKKVEAMFAAYHYPAHDFKHVLRVSKLARQIAESEVYDSREAEIAGLLHDVGRTVKNSAKPHALEGVPLAKELLDAYTDSSDDAKQRILEAIEKHSDKYTEGKLNNIVQDADKLDGMGAIGINRAYTVMAEKNIPDFDPQNIIPEPGKYGAFKTAHELIALTIEWYDMLYTDKAREIGKPRHEFMKHFMQEIKRETEEAS